MCMKPEVARLGVLLASQMEAALLLGQLGDAPQQRLPVGAAHLLPRCQTFCHALQPTDEVFEVALV